jgi:hypothetical protein
MRKAGNAANLCRTPVEIRPEWLDTPPARVLLLQGRYGFAEFSVSTRCFLLLAADLAP